MEKYKCREFTRTGNLFLPSKWGREFNIEFGTKVDVEYEPEVIYIRKANPDSTCNKRFVSEKNTVLIPKEIRESANISPDKEYCLYIDERNKQFVVAIQDDAS
jgi:bifunctional DNA-binding transcriptional regulator/antitoxin component of YhaV-PrlF toxin-antitoxin module